jgi:hypothetical protein
MPAAFPDLQKLDGGRVAMNLGVTDGPASTKYRWPESPVGV